MAQSALGVLSTEKRGIWAKNRASLMKEPGNAMSLDVLDKALFVVCLDDARPENPIEMCNNMLCESCRSIICVLPPDGLAIRSHRPHVYPG